MREYGKSRGLEVMGISADTVGLVILRQAREQLNRYERGCILFLDKPKRGGIMSEMNGKWALVTGASSGFGIEFAEQIRKGVVYFFLINRNAQAL